MWFKSKTAWKQMQQRREKLMPKTLTEKLNAIKAAGKGIFVPIYHGLETMRKVWMDSEKQYTF